MGWKCSCGRMNPEHASACIHCAKPRMGAPSVVVIPKGNVRASNQALAGGKSRSRKNKSRKSKSRKSRR